jgi:TPR repeat protein
MGSIKDKAGALRWFQSVSGEMCVRTREWLTIEMVQERAAKKNDPVAMASLATLLRDGKGGRRNVERATDPFPGRDRGSSNDAGVLSLAW